MVPKLVTRALPFIGIIVLAYLIAGAGPEKVLGTLLAVNVSYLLPAVALFMAYLLIQNFKWTMLVRRQGMDAGFWRLFRIYMVGAFYGIITPGKIGNFIRIRYVKRMSGKGTGESSVNVVFDKILDFAALFLLTSAGLITMANFISFGIFVAMIAFIIGLLVFVALLVRKKTSRKILRIFWRLFIPSQMKEKAKSSFNSFFDNSLKMRDLTIPFLITVAGWIIMYTSTFMVALSVGFEVPYLTFVLILPIATFVGLIPVTVGGWGTREATLVFLFSLFGMPADAVIVMSLVAATISYIVTLVLGASFSFIEEGKGAGK